MRVSVVWFSCVWCIWKARNLNCFNNKEINIGKLVEELKVLSWNWLHYKSKRLGYDMSQWWVNLRACLGDLVN